MGMGMGMAGGRCDEDDIIIVNGAEAGSGNGKGAVRGTSGDRFGGRGTGEPNAAGLGGEADDGDGSSGCWGLR